MFQTRVDAERVLDKLQDIIAEFEVATVADYYDLAGYSGEFTYNRWGWYDLSYPNAMVRHGRGGYVISFPRTRPVD